MSLLPPNIYPDTPGTKRLLLQTKASWAPTCSHPCNRRSSFVPEPKADLPWLIAHFGDACSSSWLEARYDIWRGVGSTWEDPKVQGYMRCGKWLFAWGNLLCQPTKERRRETAEEFVKWAKEEGLKVVWCCVDSGFEEVLAEGVDGVGWSTLSCLREDVLRELGARSSQPWKRTQLILARHAIRSRDRAFQEPRRQAEPSPSRSRRPHLRRAAPLGSRVSPRPQDQDGSRRGS